MIPHQRQRLIDCIHSVDSSLLLMENSEPTVWSVQRERSTEFMMCVSCCYVTLCTNSRILFVSLTTGDMFFMLSTNIVS